MWTTENRPRYNRDKLRYPSDLTDEEWTVVEPLIPPAKHGGRRRTVMVRDVVNGAMYVLSTGCQWTSCQKSREKWGGAVTPPQKVCCYYVTIIVRRARAPDPIKARAVLAAVKSASRRSAVAFGQS